MAVVDRKLRVGIIFGGRSSEHEVSLNSAASIIDHLDEKKYDVVPIGITKAGKWLSGIPPTKMLAREQEAEHDLKPALIDELYAINNTIDVAFPVMHGTYGEDGTLQGLLEMVNIPYVGCGVLGSALGMDKEKMKMIFRSVGLPTANSLTYRRHHWQSMPEMIMDAIEQYIGYPCFVKPTNSGSSIGVSKVYKRKQLRDAIQLATEYDNKVLIEENINCREVECSVLGYYDPVASLVGEVIMNHDFYDYDAKYFDKDSHTVVPADLPWAVTEEVRRLSIQAFLALDLSGLARVDFFIEKKTHRVFLNEVNTLPSFTPQCMYPKLCAASGLTYSLLLDQLIDLAFERYDERQRNRIYCQI